MPDTHPETQTLDDYAREMLDGCIASARAAMHETFATYGKDAGLPSTFLAALEARVTTAEITYRLAGE